MDVVPWEPSAEAGKATEESRSAGEEVGVDSVTESRASPSRHRIEMGRPPPMAGQTFLASHHQRSNKAERNST